MKLPLSDIKIDPTIQIRRRNHEATIQRYEEAFEKLPPIDVFDTPEGLLVSDGFHRIAAAERLGLREIEANVIKGTRDDAAEHAVIANTKNADPLTPEERDDGIRRLKQLHPKWSLRQIADAMSISYRTVKQVFDVDEVRRSVFTPAVNALTDTHLREVARAPRAVQQPLIEAAAGRGWSTDVMGLAVRNLKDDRIPEKRKREILQGKADPVVVREDGQFAVPPSVIGRQLREMEANDAILAMEKALAALAQLRLFRPEIIVATIGQPRLDHVISEMPGYISFMQEIVAAATRATKPRAVS